MARGLILNSRPATWTFSSGIYRNQNPEQADNVHFIYSRVDLEPSRFHVLSQHTLSGQVPDGPVVFLALQSLYFTTYGIC